MLRSLIKSLLSPAASREPPPRTAAQELQSGLDLHNAGRVAEAAQAYRRALALDPALPAGEELLGRALAAAGEHAEALAALDAAIRRHPDSVRAHFTRGLVLLALDDYAGGWPEYEWRWHKPEMQTIRRLFAQRWWTGEDIRGGTLLVFAEQGFGDAMQFARFVPTLGEATGARIVLDCHPPLKALLGRVDGVAEVLSSDQEIARYPLCLPLMSVPGALRIGAEALSRNVPYLSASPEHVARWRGIVASGRRLNVGLAWASDPGGGAATERSVPLPLLATLAEVPGVDFHSVVPGALANAAPAGGMKIVDHSARLKDFSETAGLITQLDLVISVDTAVTHLAGGMGKPTWVLLRRAGDWRWGAKGSTSRWYPSVRIFRQADEGDWAGVLAEVAAALREFAAERVPSAA